jgi:hypothetical protein
VIMGWKRWFVRGRRLEQRRGYDSWSSGAVIPLACNPVRIPPHPPCFFYSWMYVLGFLLIDFPSILVLCCIID